MSQADNEPEMTREDLQRDHPLLFALLRVEFRAEGVQIEAEKKHRARKRARARARRQRRKQRRLSTPPPSPPGVAE